MSDNWSPEPFEFEVSPPGDAASDYAPTEEWALMLPHQCGEWIIGHGERDFVLSAANRFRDDLDKAIAALEAVEGNG
jgi:hypothetical protein